MTRHMLDTNTVSHLLKGHPAVCRRAVDLPMASLCISAITEGELLFGLARRPEARRLHAVVREFLLRVDTLPWGGDVAAHYGSLRAELEGGGIGLGPLDLLIAAHARALDLTLVTNDGAFGRVGGLRVADWTA